MNIIKHFTSNSTEKEELKKYTLDAIKFNIDQMDKVTFIL